MRRLLAAVAACGTLVAAAVGPVASRADSVPATGPGTTPAGTTYGVGVLTVAYTDPSRVIRRLHRRLARPRTLVTVIRYPTVTSGSTVTSGATGATGATGSGGATGATGSGGATGSAAVTEARGAAPASGPFPLVVFAHGFDATPARYARLLDAWTHAGYVVAAPIFPLTSARAPGGPRESDLVNQPADLSLVISRLLAASASGHGILGGRLDPNHIAVAGQSDGGSTALATTAARMTVDHRIAAAVVLSGARIPGIGGYTFPVPSPPLLAVQGTADDSNAPASTLAWFRPAPAPKYLLWLWGAGHLPPYTSEEPQLGVVEAVTTAFLDRYLRADPTATARMWAAANVDGTANLSTRG